MSRLSRSATGRSHRRVSGAKDIFEALIRLGAFGPPGGGNADMDREVEAQEEESPMALPLPAFSYFGTGDLGTHLLAGDEENKRLMNRGRQRRFHIGSTASSSTRRCSMRRSSHHGRPSHEELAEHFSTELIGEVRGERIARAVEFFWDEEYDESAHLIVPRLESILREVARLNGIPSLSVPRGQLRRRRLAQCDPLEASRALRPRSLVRLSRGPALRPAGDQSQKRHCPWHPTARRRGRGGLADSGCLSSDSGSGNREVREVLSGAGRRRGISRDLKEAGL